MKKRFEILLGLVIFLPIGTSLSSKWYIFFNIHSLSEFLNDTFLILLIIAIYTYLTAIENIDSIISLYNKFNDQEKTVLNNM